MSNTTPNLCPQCGKPECNCQSDWANSINEAVSPSQPIDKPYREQYETHPNTDVISTPGKFEGEGIYVPFYYDSWGNGCATEDLGSVAFFEILEDERQAFPELGQSFGIALEESEQGFVYASVYDTREEYESALAKVQGTDEEESGRISCPHCQLLRINGVICHETGCPNSRAKYIDGEWVRFRECRECGAEIREGESCNCQDASDDNAEVL